MPAEERTLTSGMLSKEPRIGDWRSAYKHQTRSEGFRGSSAARRRLRRAPVSLRATSLTWPSTVCLAVKPVGEPDAGNPHVRFDERGGETE